MTAENTKGPLVVVVGPTAVGKTEVALMLAEAANGEVVSADSRQVYRLLDIGTAKPTVDDLARVPHHLVDFLPPDAWLTVAEFQAQAYHAIDDILSRKKVPLLVGGTGQYVQAVVEGWGIPHVLPNQSLRAELESFGGVFGPTALHDRLVIRDPEAARAIDLRNVRRVVRALEVCLETGDPISLLQRKRPPPYRTMRIGLTRPRSRLYARVDERVERMISEGLVEEVANLSAAGFGWGLPSMSSLGYAQVGQYLRGEITLGQALAMIKRETRRFIRHQYTWFRLDDLRIRWFDLDKTNVTDIVSTVQGWLNRAGLESQPSVKDG